MAMVRGALNTGGPGTAYFTMTQRGQQKILRPEEGEVRLVALDELTALNETLGKQIDVLRKEDKFPWFDTQERDSHPVYVDANDVTAYLLDRQGRVRSNADFQDLWSALSMSITFPVRRRVGWNYHPAKALDGTGRLTHLGLLLNGNTRQQHSSQEEPRATLSPFVAVLATQVYKWWKEEGHIRYDAQHNQYYVRVGAKGQTGDFKERHVGLEKRVSVGAAALASGLLEGKAKSYEHAAGKRMRRFEAEQDPATRYFESRKFEIKGGGRSRVTGMKAIGTLYLSLIAPIGRKGPGPKAGASVVAIEDAAALLFHADIEYVQRAFETVGLQPFGEEGKAYRPEDVRKQLITPVMDAAVTMYLQPAR